MKGRVFPRPYQLVEGERRPIKGKSTWTFEFMVQRGGKRRSISKGGYRTKSDADKALAEALVDHGAAGPSIDPDKRLRTMTLATFVRDEWLPVLTNLKPSTVRSYRDLAEAYLLPHLGDHQMTELTPNEIVKLYATLRTRGRRKPAAEGASSGLSESSVHHVHVLLSKVLRYATQVGAVASNPIVLVPDDPRPKAQAPDPAKLRTWSRAQAGSFLASIAGDRLEALWRLAIDTGMRRGELAALRWEDVDLDACRVIVRRNRVTIGYAVAEGTPKTRTGQRAIDLDDATVATLKAHRRRQLEDRMSWGEAWVNVDELVFVREDGSPLHPQTIGWQLARASKAAAVPAIGVHGLRHTCATLGLAAGVPLKVMSERLGHSSTTITADLYQHVVPGMQADAARQIMAGLG